MVDQKFVTLKFLIRKFFTQRLPDQNMASREYGQKPASTALWPPWMWKMIPKSSDYCHYYNFQLLRTNTNRSKTIRQRCGIVDWVWSCVVSELCGMVRNCSDSDNVMWWMVLWVWCDMKLLGFLHGLFCMHGLVLVWYGIMVAWGWGITCVGMIWHRTIG